MDCFATLFAQSSRANEVYAWAEASNPALLKKCVRVEVGAMDDLALIQKYSDEVKPDFVLIGPEQPLAAGVVDTFERQGIPAIGPTKSAAQIETSKSFARKLLERSGSRYNPKHRHFIDTEGLRDYLVQFDEFVIKPDGLTGGKGVKVFGDHFKSMAEGIDYCEEVLSHSTGGLLIEEKLDGEEFSLQSFCDGTHITHSPLVQDHKRAFEGDAGPNTGGVGAYSFSDHSLPFLSAETTREARAVNELVYASIKREFGESYRGILYGNFIVTAQGLKVIEYNARFGDPEGLNILSILKNDFLDVCDAMLTGKLDQIEIEFEAKSTVCKWVVPRGYPDDPARGGEIDPASIASSDENLKTYFGAVDGESGTLKLKGARAIAFVGIADSISDAEQIAEKAAVGVRGPVYHRKDIGTDALIQQRIRHMQELTKRYGHRDYA
jgi:phosphoribosylamine--glycine ligase